MFRARPKSFRPTEVSAKVKPPADHARPGKHVPRSAKLQRHATPRTTSRASRETSLAAAQPFAYHGRCIRPSRERTSHVRPRNHRPNLIRRPRRPTMKHPATTVPTRPKTRLSGRSSRPTVRTPRSTRSRF
ncbi:unnamed protein product [Microthlaspi erraticum]|uniref:Uncharacterized protein n=1 Tax=Microthlaspi erraticum TaxID=1685480 RepID=A0A6D2I5M4_9BRAS|nr:unnamed protein product [Microthlaspi erraticum]